MQYTYDYIYNLQDEKGYGLILTSVMSQSFKELNFGKYDTVSKKTLDNIYLKSIESYQHLIKFLDDLKFIKRQSLPSIISIDRFNLFLGFDKPPILKNGKFNLKSIKKLTEILSRIKEWNQSSDLVFFVTCDIEGSIDSENSKIMFKECNHILGDRIYYYEKSK